MITLQSLVLLASVSSPGQAVLFDFYSDRCPPCRSMDPIVRRLIADGYAVRKVNVDREQQTSRKFRIHAVPTFIMTVDGQEVKRFVGPTTYSQLVGMFPGVGPANAPAAATPNLVTPVSHVSSEPPPKSGIDLRARAMQATVRLRVEDPKGNSFGTGTIIDTHGDEALIMTCAHIFRDSGGRGTIMVDMFAPGAAGPVPGVLIDYDLKHDTALVAIRPAVKVMPVPVPPKTYQVRAGDRVFNIGCDHGRNPTLHDTHVTAINKYVRPANIVAAGEPVIGRSGGGLFSSDGQLIGVCNLADPTDKEGIYAALPLLHDGLDRTGLAQVYQRNAQQIASTPTAPPSPNLKPLPSRQPPSMPKQMPRSPLDDQRLAPVPQSAIPPSEPRAPFGWGHPADDTEITMILRSKSNPQSPRVVILDRASPDMLNWLSSQSRSRGDIEPIVLETSDPAASIASRPSRTAPDGRSGSVVRGQSEKW